MLHVSVRFLCSKQSSFMSFSRLHRPIVRQSAHRAEEGDAKLSVAVMLHQTNKRKLVIIRSSSFSVWTFEGLRSDVTVPSLSLVHWLYVWKTPLKKQNAAKDEPGSVQVQFKKHKLFWSFKEACQLLSYAKSLREMNMWDSHKSVELWFHSSKIQKSAWWNQIKIENR